MLSQTTNYNKFSTVIKTITTNPPILSYLSPAQNARLVALMAANRIIAEEAISLIEAYELTPQHDEIIENTITAAEMLAAGQLRDPLPLENPVSYCFEVARVTFTPAPLTLELDNYNSHAVIDDATREGLLTCTCHNIHRPQPVLYDGQEACPHILAVLLAERVELAEEEMQHYL